MIVVAIAPSLIWPSKKTARQSDGRTADSGHVVPKAADSNATAAGPSGRPAVRPTQTADTGRTIWATSPPYRLGFSTRGSRLVSAELPNSKSLAPTDSQPPGPPLPVSHAV